MINQESIEQVRKKAGVSYEEARLALEENNNDIIAAITCLKKKKKTNSSDEELKIDVKFIMEVIKELISEGTARKIVIKKNNNIILNIPIIVGAIGLIWAPIIGVLGAGAAFVYEYNILIVKNDNEEIDVIKYAIKKAKDIKEKINIK